MKMIKNEFCIDYNYTVIIKKVCSINPVFFLMLCTFENDNNKSFIY